jgi:hypothetical protein
MGDFDPALRHRLHQVPIRGLGRVLVLAAGWTILPFERDPGQDMGSQLL